MATHIKSVNTKLICNGEDLSKKLNEGVGEIENFAKAASKEITVPLKPNRQKAGSEDWGYFTPTDATNKPVTFGSGAASFMRGAGWELFTQFKEMDTTKPMEWGKVMDTAVHTMSAGLNQLGPKGIAAAVALETVYAAGNKLGDLLGNAISPVAKIDESPTFNEFMRNRDRAQTDIEQTVRGLEKSIATRGMSSAQVGLWDLNRFLADTGQKPTENMKWKMDRARQLDADLTRITDADMAAEKAKRLREQQQLETDARVKSFADTLGGPAVRAQCEFRDMGNWRNAGLITGDQFNEGALNTIRGLERQFNVGGRGRVLAGASGADSVEGATAILTAKNADRPRSMEERLIDLNEKIEQHNKKQKEETEEIRRILQNRPGLVAGLVQ